MFMPFRMFVKYFYTAVKNLDGTIPFHFENTNFIARESGAEGFTCIQLPTPF